MTERFSNGVSFNFINLFNHSQFLNPVLNIVGNSTTVGGIAQPHGRSFAANDGVRIACGSKTNQPRFDRWLTAKGKVQSNLLSFRVVARNVGGYSEVKLSVPIQDFARDFRLLL